MELTIEQALKGKATRIKDKEYLQTKAYIEPFLDRMSKFTSEFKIKAELPNQYTLTKTGEVDMEDITFNRMWIQAILPDEYAFSNHKEVIGMIYGLDVRKPIVKFYKGALNMACTNLSVFNPEQLSVNELAPETGINFSPIKRIMEQTCDISKYLHTLSNTEFPLDQEFIERELGRWVNNSIIKSYDNGFGKVKLANSTVLDAYKNLFINDKSEYFLDNSNNNMFTVYNAFTHQISNKDKDIMNTADKTYLLKQILDI